MTSTAPTLLFLHGALGAAAQFEPLITALGDRVRVHALDFEGHATGLMTSRPFRIEHFAENVLGFLDRAQLHRVHVFGYSMGGYVACHIAATYPGRIARIATLGTKFRWDPATAERETKRLDPATILAKVPRFAEALRVRHEHVGGWELVLSKTAESMRALGEQPLLTDQALGNIEIPVRIIVGDRDNTVSIEEAAGVARALPKGELAVLPRTPHPIEQAEIAALADLLLTFFNPANSRRQE